MRVGRFLGVLICVGGSALAAGCGTVHAGSGGGEPVSLAAAVSRTQDQTARIAITMTSQIQGMTISYTETGEYDFARSRGTISMQGPVDMTEVFLPPTTYIKMPSGGSGLPKGKSWIAVPDSDIDGSTGIGALLGSPENGADPADLLAALMAASSSVTKLGPSVIRGVPVTGYGLTIDPAKAGAIPGAGRAAVEGLLKSLAAAKIPVDVWVDGQNLVRRETLSLAMPSVSGTSDGGSGALVGGKLTMTTDFYDFGAPVTVSAPPEGQVVKEPQSFSAAGSSVTPAVSASASAVAEASPPPAASGTLTPDQATAAEQAVTAFWAALGSNNTAAVAATVPPAQRSCVQSSLGSGAPTITVSDLHITSAEPAGNSGATVRFTVKAEASLDGQDLPVLPEGSGSTQWLATTEVAGRWYVNLSGSTSLAFGGCS